VSKIQGLPDQTVFKKNLNELRNAAPFKNQSSFTQNEA
jgi:hypothetical protein